MNLIGGKRALEARDSDGHMKAWAPKRLEVVGRDSW
jgi:hypothetical protein